VKTLKFPQLKLSIFSLHLPICSLGFLVLSSPASLMIVDMSKKLPTVFNTQISHLGLGIVRDGGESFAEDNA
jgi:hypothetical protein